MTTPTGTLTPDFRHNIAPQHGVISIRGGKGRIAPWVVSHFPRHARYVDAFFGAGHIYFAKEHAPFEVVNDLDRQVTTFFQCLRDQPADLIAQIWATPYSREEFATALQEATNLSPLEEARAFFTRQNQGFAGKAQSIGDWGVAQDAFRGVPSSVSTWQTQIALLAGAAQQLRNAMIERQDFEQVIRRYATPDTLIYCDPPYLPETRTGADYRNEMSTADHERLLRLITTTDALVVLSGYASPLYHDYLQGWDCVTLEVMANSAGRVRERKGKAAPRRTECLWRNPQTMAAIAQQRTLWEVA